MASTRAKIKITNVASDWNADSSDIIPNFGDYTDNYVVARSFGPPFTGKIEYTAWSDGRLGVPQPFEAHITHLARGKVVAAVPRKLGHSHHLSLTELFLS